MEHKIIKKEKNPFLSREEIILEIENETSPSFSDVLNLIGKGEDLAVVKKIEGNFGKQSFTAEVFVYDSAQIKKGVEVIPKKIRKKLEEEEKKRIEEEKAKAEEEAKAKAEETKEDTEEKGEAKEE